MNGIRNKMDDLLQEITDQIEEYLRTQQINGVRYILPQADVEQVIISNRDKKKAKAQQPPVKSKVVVAPVDPVKELRSMANDLSKCQKCIHLAQSRSNVIFGEGNPRAQIMFIGEAPGADEDRQGRPFVGKAGQLLTKMLAAVGIDRNDVYIANILKCRPPGNRNPDQTEVEHCIGYLYRQIELIAPKLICTLGSVATQSLLDVKEGITRIRGKQFDFKGCTLVPTFHPSYLLRSTHMKREAWMDMLLIKKIITEI